VSWLWPVIAKATCSVQLYSSWDLWCTKLHHNGLLSGDLNSPLSVLCNQCFKLILILKVFLSEGQAAWVSELTNKAVLFRIRGASDKFSLVLSLQRPQWWMYSSADKSLARPASKQLTATEDFKFHISYL